MLAHTAVPGETKGVGCVMWWENPSEFRPENFRSYRVFGHATGGRITYTVIPTSIDITTALLGDDRPAPNADEWETQMLRLLAGEATS